MWPKAFAQLIELAPHISRLLPMADRFFQTKAAGEDTTRRAVENLGDRIRADLSQVNSTQAGLADQISDVSGKLNRVAADSEALKRSAEMLKASAESLERRLAQIEARQNRTIYLNIFLLIATTLVLVLLGLLLARGH